MHIGQSADVAVLGLSAVFGWNFSACVSAISASGKEPVIHIDTLFTRERKMLPANLREYQEETPGKFPLRVGSRFLIC